MYTASLLWIAKLYFCASTKVSHKVQGFRVPIFRVSTAAVIKNRPWKDWIYLFSVFLALLLWERPTQFKRLQQYSHKWNNWQVLDFFKKHNGCFVWSLSVVPLIRSVTVLRLIVRLHWGCYFWVSKFVIHLAVVKTKGKRAFYPGLPVVYVI